MRWQVEWSKSRGESPGNSDRKMNEFVTANESRTMTAHGIFNTTSLMSRECEWIMRNI